MEVSTMADPTVRVRATEPPVHADLVLTRLACADVDLEDQATEAEPDTVLLRIGDAHAGVLLCGDLVAVQRLITKADRQLAHLSDDRQATRR
jgi:hypothetical protein